MRFRPPPYGRPSPGRAAHRAHRRELNDRLVDHCTTLDPTPRMWTDEDGIAWALLDGRPMSSIAFSVLEDTE